MNKHYKLRKRWRNFKAMVKKFFKWLFSSQGATFIITLMSFAVALCTLKIAHTTYKFASLDFSLLPEFELSNECLTISNPNEDIFRIKNIEVKEYEEYRILDSNLYLFNTLYYCRERSDNDNPNLNKVSINLNEPYQTNGEVKDMEDFKKIYQDKILYLKGDVKTEYEQTFYVVYIEYVNLRNYQNENLELEIFFNDKNEITFVDPLAERITRYNRFEFVEEYAKDDFGSEWQFFMQFLNKAKERDAMDD